jgi:hypothetical protein
MNMKNTTGIPIVIIAAAALLAGCARNQTPAASAPPSPEAAQGPHTSFATPEEAADALAAALRNGDAKALGELLGPGTTDLLSSGDPVEDTSERTAFVAAYDAAHSLVAGDKDNLALLVGQDRWPLPIPLVQHDGRWSFDGAAGIQEILLRRIGANELRTINVMRNYVGAQSDYAAHGHDGLPAGLYATKLNSSPGKQDGLYWETPAGKPTSPAGPFLAAAAAEGYGEKVTGAAPYHGYLYRRLDSQGADAPGGAIDYTVDGKLAKGYALLAYPSNYGSSGIMSFIVSQDGVVWQKDLGEDTAKAAQAITQFNPDTSWTPLAPEG